ncbi:hypothetical protein V8F06_014598 [Rhypophila decipiens]
MAGHGGGAGETETVVPCTGHCHCTTPPVPGHPDPALEEVDSAIWTHVCGFYPDGFIDLISPQIATIPAWASKLYGEARKIWDGHGDRPGNPCFPMKQTDISYSINLADMQRLYMRYLQAKLIDCAVANRFDDDKGFAVLGEFTTTMKDYVQAVRDHEYMKAFSQQPSDPFLVSGRHLHDRDLLDNAITPELVNGMAAAFLPKKKENDTRSDLERLIAASLPTGPWEGTPKKGKGAQAIGSTRGDSMKRAFWSRFAGAIIGGAFLVGPMWLLVLVRDRWVHLGVTTACVFAFGILASWFLSTLEGVFAATFAYAAVLMVFVGVIMQEQNA